MKIRSLSKLLVVFILLTCATRAKAESRILDNLAGTWSDLDGFASIGQCISSPSNSAFICSPTQLPRVQKGRFEGRGTVSATDSVLAVSDSLRKNEISSSDISTLFKDYNYTDLLMNVDLNYVTKNFIFGIRPVRYQGQFEVHNPNLPYVSLAFREDHDFHAGIGKSFGNDAFRWSVGGMGSLLFRDETLVEATVVDLASRPAKDLLDRQKLRGYFFDLGTSFEFSNLFNVAVLGKDLGDWFSGQHDHVDRFLFVHSDKMPKVFISASVLPALAGGRLQIGASTVRFIKEANRLDKQWFGTVAYYVGPLRIITGWRPDLFRSSLAMRFSRFEANVAQEWVNLLETGRKTQPRFTLEITTGL